MASKKSKVEKKIGIKSFLRNGKRVKAFRRRQKVNREETRNSLITVAAALGTTSVLTYVLVKAKNKSKVTNPKPLVYPDVPVKPKKPQPGVLKEKIEDLVEQKKDYPTEKFIEDVQQVSTPKVETTTLTPKATPEPIVTVNTTPAIYEQKLINYPEVSTKRRRHNNFLVAGASEIEDGEGLRRTTEKLIKSIKDYGLDSDPNKVDIARLTLESKSFQVNQQPVMAPYRTNTYDLTFTEVEALNIYTKGSGHPVMNGVDRGIFNLFDEESLKSYTAHTIDLRVAERMHAYSEIVDYSLRNKIPKIQMQSTDHYLHRVSWVDDKTLESWLQAKTAPLYTESALLSTSTQAMKTDFDLKQEDFDNLTIDQQQSSTLANYWHSADETTQSRVYFRIRPDSRGKGESLAGYIGDFGQDHEFEALFPKGSNFLVEGIRLKRGQGHIMTRAGTKGNFFSYYEVDLREVNPRFNSRVIS